MKDATYKDGILTIKGIRYCVLDKFDGGGKASFMILREEGDSLMIKKQRTAEWVFPEKMDNIEDYDWENTAYLKSVK